MPTNSSDDRILASLADISDALQNPHPRAPFHTGCDTDNIRHRLTELFVKQSDTPPPTSTAPGQAQSSPPTSTAPGQAPITDAKPPRVVPSTNSNIKKITASSTPPIPEVPHPKPPTIPAEQWTTEQCGRRHSPRIAKLPTYTAGFARAVEQLQPNWYPENDVTDHVPPHHANAVIDDVTGKELNYRALIQHPIHKNTWLRSGANEFGRLFQGIDANKDGTQRIKGCLLYTSPSPRDLSTSRMPSSA